MEKKEKSLHDHFVVIQNLLVVGLVIMLSSVLFPHTDFYWILLVIGSLVMIASVVYASKHFKCPHCWTKLDPRRKVPNFCPNCGKELN